MFMKRRHFMIVLCFVLLSLLLATTVQAQERTHTVQPGDTLQSIASRYNVPLEVLAALNGIIDPNRIRVGQVLRIPAATTTAPRTHTVQHGETLRWIAERYNTTVAALMQANNISNANNIFVGQVLTLPAMGGPSTFVRYHNVDTGETLRSIATLYGTTWQALAAANGITNANYIQAGTRLLIPAVGGVQPAPQPAPAPAPAPAPVARSYTVQPGDTLSQIAERFGVTVESIRVLNNITDNRAIFPGDILRLPPTGGPVVVQPAPAPVVSGRYIVQPGDTMFRIAARHGVNVYRLAEANGILNLNQIYAGQVLVIPR